MGFLFKIACIFKLSCYTEGIKYIVIPTGFTRGISVRLTITTQQPTEIPRRP